MEILANLDPWKLFDYGVPTGIAVVLIWYFAKPWNEFLRDRAKTKAEQEDKRNNMLAASNDLNSKTLAQLQQSFSGMQAILKTESEIAKKAHRDINGIWETVQGQRKDREAIVRAIRIVEALPSVGDEVRRGLESVRSSLEEDQGCDTT